MPVNKELVKEEIQRIADINSMIAEQYALDEEQGGVIDNPFNWSWRSNMWEIFATEVASHINNYSVPQYGDFPADQMTTASDADIIHNMKRYINRYESNSRGEMETDRDLIKLAHYACILWCKRLGFEDGVREYISNDCDLDVNNSVSSTRSNELPSEFAEQGVTEPTTKEQE